MKKFSLSIILSILFSTYSVRASDTASVRYFPLNVGDYYSYLYFSEGRPFPPVSYLKRSEVTKDTIINNKKYYFVTNLPDKYSNCWMRTDNITGSLYKFDSTNSCSFYQYETLLDSFSIHLFDTIKNCTSPPLKCADTNTIILFNNYQARSKYFVFDNGFPGWNYRKRFANNFGMTYYSRNSIDVVLRYTLLGCKINGIVYGDTTSLGVNLISSVIPETHTLYQNYPNPFNPETKLGFGIFKNAYVSLKVYNSLGQEVIDLVNEQLTAGNYEVIFDGRDYTSGIYFYILTVDQNVTDTKHMILLK